MQSLLWQGLCNALLATVLAMLAAGLGCICRCPTVRHAVWLLVLLKLITPSLVPITVSWPQMEEIKPSAEQLEIGLVPSSEAASSDIVPDEGERDALVSGSEPSLRDTLMSESTSPSRPLLDYWMPALSVVWFGGALTWWITAAMRLGQFQRMLCQTQAAPVDVQERALRLAALLRMPRCPSVVFISAPLSPMLWALGFSPRLLVPTALWAKLATEQQDTLLAHELAHFRRGDHWVRRLELLVLGLYWWHPVVWWAQRQLQAAEEECCDDLVVAVLPDAAPAYASALVETVTFLSQMRPAAFVGSSGAGHVPLLKRRLTMILSETSSRKPSRIAFWTVLGLGALLLPLAPRAARTEAPDEPEQGQTKDQINSPVGTLFGSLLNSENIHVQGIFKAKDCAVCHTLGNVQAHDFHGRPQSWREAHDEIIRLMKELDRRQVQLRESTKDLTAVSETNRAQAIEKLQDEIELLKVQVQLKEAHIQGAKETLQEYRTRLTNYESVNKSTPGAIQRDTLRELQLQITTHESQLRINVAELQEPLVRLKQAERRLARLQSPKPPSGTVPPHNLLEIPGQVAAPMAWNVTWAEAVFDRHSVDLGNVKQGTSVATTFRMTNQGQRPIHVKLVRSSNACLSARATAYDLPPGGEAAIVTQLDTKGISGSITLKVIVEFDKPERLDVPLEIRAHVEAAARDKPQSPERLRELERKLDELRKEMESLRHEMRPDKPH